MESPMVHLCAAVANVGDLARDLRSGELSEVLAEYKALMIEAIEAEQGFYSGALGDQLTGYWGGIPSQTPGQSALHACRAAAKQVKAAAADPKLAALRVQVIVGIAGEQDRSVALCKLCRQTSASV